jgi:hypothetical protein
MIKSSWQQRTARILVGAQNYHVENKNNDFQFLMQDTQ